MINFESQKLDKQGSLLVPHLTYHEIISYLDNHWAPSVPETIKKIDAILGSIASKLPSLIIAGTSGKSTTIYYLTKLLEAEGLKVGVLTSPHFNFYNERIAINQKIISHDTFVTLANAILEIIATNNISATSKDILTAMSLLHFKNEKVEIVILEQEQLFEYDPVRICIPQILGITRIVLPTKELTSNAINALLASATSATHVASADQSKLVLHEIAQKTKEQNSSWIMPIRKIAPLPYPYEQLHGRCAALAERIAQIYINHMSETTELQPKTSLLRLVKKQRGRPSLTSKQYMNYPQKNTIQFWKTVDTKLPNHFQLIEQKNNTILLDTAANLDALQNLLLGIRLLNYEKPFKSISFLLGCYDGQFDQIEFIKTVRYFFKKMSGQLSFCPISNSIGEQTGTSWDLEKIATIAQHAKIKVSVYKNFKTAFESTAKQLYGPQDLLVITGSQAIISEYLKYKKNKENG